MASEKKGEGKSKFEVAKETLSEGIKDVGPEELWDRVVMLVEALEGDVGEGLEVLSDSIDESTDEHINTRMRLLEAHSNHARKLVLGYASLAVAFGQKAGVISAEGEPSKTLPESMQDMISGLQMELADFKEIWEEIHDEDFEDASLMVEDDDGKEGGANVDG